MFYVIEITARTLQKYMRICIGIQPIVDYSGARSIKYWKGTVSHIRKSILMDKTALKESQ